MNSTKWYLLSVLTLTPFLAMAQVCNAPIDGGLSFLAIAGVGYGVKKYADKKKKKEEANSK